MSIVPYGHYSLREVFNKVGLAVFSDEWDDSIPSFVESIQGQDDRESIIYPITEPFLIFQIESFMSHRYTEEEINILSRKFFDSCKVHDEKAKKEGSEISAKSLISMGGRRLNSEVNLIESSNETKDSTEIAREKQLAVLEARNRLDERNTNLIRQGIKYPHIAKGLRQILHSTFLTGIIIDKESGQQLNLPKEFWLASASAFSFETSTGYYKHFFSYQYIWNGKSSNTSVTKEYNGLIIF